VPDLAREILRHHDATSPRSGDPHALTTVEGYGNLLGSRADMVTHVRAGDVAWTVKGQWRRRTARRWSFRDVR